MRSNEAGTDGFVASLIAGFSTEISRLKNKGKFKLKRKAILKRLNRRLIMLVRNFEWFFIANPHWVMMNNEGVKRSY